MPADPFLEFVRRFETALAAPLPAPAPRPPPPAPQAGAPVGLLFSPHPDDEVITGALPLRLQREVGARVINIAVTLGSNPARQEARRRELEAACAYLGWDLEVLGWTGVNPDANMHSLDEWQARVREIVAIIRRLRPAWIFYPHANDAHPTHVGTHLYVNTAIGLAAEPDSPPPYRILTEYWQPNVTPNLLVECPPTDLADLVGALGCHEGEIARNPYHRTLPAWMIDNVRRGAERVAGAGVPAPRFPFGVLYQVEPARPPTWPAIIPAVTALTV